MKTINKSIILTIILTIHKIMEVITEMIVGSAIVGKVLTAKIVTLKKKTKLKNYMKILKKINQLVVMKV